MVQKAPNLHDCSTLYRRLAHEYQTHCRTQALYGGRNIGDLVLHNLLVAVLPDHLLLLLASATSIILFVGNEV